MKTKQFIYGFALLFSLFIGGNAIAQTEISASDFTEEWTLLAEDNGIKLYAKKGYCDHAKFEDDMTFAMVKVENTTGTSVEAEYQIGVLYDAGCDGCEYTPERNKVVTVSANSSVESDCNEFGNLMSLISNPALKGYDTRKFEGIRLIEFKAK